MYVECETAICFVNTYRGRLYTKTSTESDTAYTHWYMSQLKEMFDQARNHNSVVLWSAGNDSRYGTNIQMSYDWLKAIDPTKPVIFSYSSPESPYKHTDIKSIHYPHYLGLENKKDKTAPRYFASDDILILYDEWAHVPCYNKQDLLSDPSVQDFFGISLDPHVHESLRGRWLYGRCYMGYD